MKKPYKTYQNSIQKFKQIPKNERTNYNTKTLTVEQSKDPPPVLFIKEFQSKQTFQYQGYKLNYFSIENNNKPKAIVIHFHGLSSHGGPAAYYAQQIVSICPQVNFYAFDQMNFGRSEGPCRGYISSLDDSVNQGETFVNFLLNKWTDKPRIFLSGSSFGGTIIFKMALRNSERYSGLIMLVPALRDLSQSKPCLKRLAKFLGYIIPRVHIPNTPTYDSGTKYNCTDLRNKDEYACQNLIVPGTIAQVLYGIQEISNEYKNLKNPYILLQGGIQKLVDPFAPIDLQELSSSQDKTTVYYQNLWHSVFYEEQIQDMSHKVGQWVRKRLS